MTENKKKIPLTLPQLDIFNEQQRFPNEPIYNIGANIKIEGSINLEAMCAAYENLINQHDLFRARVRVTKYTPFLEIAQKGSFQLELVDLTLKADASKVAQKLVKKAFKKTFNLLNERTLHRFILIRVNDHLHYLFSVYHHIITDGWGTSLMYQRLITNYNEILSAGKVISNYPYSYMSFVEDDEKYQSSEKLETDRSYWLNKFKDLPEPLIVAKNKVVNKSSRVKLRLDRNTYSSIRKISDSTQTSIFHFLLSVLCTYLFRYFQRDDMVIGIPVLNRSTHSFKKTVGLFTGISPLRIQIDPEWTFLELLSQVKKEILADYRHQRYPLGKLITDLKLIHSDTQLLNVTFSYEKHNYSEHFCNTRTNVVPLTHESERVAIAIYVREFDEINDIVIDLDYNLSYIPKREAAKIANGLKFLFTEVVSAPYEKIRNLAIITDHERHQVLQRFNSTNFNSAGDLDIISSLEYYAKITPDKVATYDLSKQLTYAQLGVLTNRIAHYLATRIGLKDSPIALIQSRSTSLVAVILGIMKSGHPYLPLDPNLPEERIKYILQQSKCQDVIADTENLKRSCLKGMSIHSVENVFNTICSDAPTTGTGRFTNQTNLAYIIYTSGSTGKPKGVEISYKSLNNFLGSMRDQPGMNSHDRILAVTTYSFDISILELLLPVACGGTSIIVKASHLADPIQVLDIIQKERPTIIQATPSFFQLLYDNGWHGDSEIKILCGGDSISTSLCAKLINTCQEVWNMYGPTETTIWSTIKKIDSAKDATNIGRPIRNTQIYILDRWGNPQPIGAIGTIHIAGSGLANGYYLDPELTEKKFKLRRVTNSERLYDTGDLGCWSEAGEIMFHGRQDTQVKIRGFRVELGEIEKCMQQLDQVEESVVIIKKSNGMELLVGYVRICGNLTHESIFKHLRSLLPNYMIPNQLINVDKFPLTPNRKVDRSKLLDITPTTSKQETASQYPASNKEKKLVNLYRKILHLKEFSPTEDFFQAGGNSILAAKLSYQVSRMAGRSILPQMIYTHPTARQLLEKINEKVSQPKKKKSHDASFERYPLSNSQYNIWLTSQNESEPSMYNMGAVYEVSGNLNLDAFSFALNSVVRKYPILRTNFIDSAGKIYQVPKEDTLIEVPELEVDEANLEPIIEEFLNYQFNLKSDTLIRLALFRTKNGLRKLAFLTHHIVMDGMSFSIFIKLLSEGYKKTVKNSENTVVNERHFISYVNYEQIQSKNPHAERYWRKKLGNLKPIVYFPRDNHSNINHRNVLTEQFHFNSSETNRLREIANQSKCTLFSLLLSSVAGMIHEYSTENDIRVGYIASGRDRPELINQIGMFTNTLISRLKIEQNSRFRSIMVQANREIQASLKYQHFPLSKISANFSKIFDVLIVEQENINTTNKAIKIAEFQLKEVEFPKHQSRFPIVFNFKSNRSQITCDLDYDPKIYDIKTINLIIRSYQNLITNITKDANLIMSPERHIYEIANEIRNSIDIQFNF